ncbi:hypothetical protein E2C01_099285 [Portunus trituberculatus]|uniref:Uncharacterized protein n=1 Tax=Portunus trituberculatus TaxID=210409 RepID=A0A5B7KAF7_PORTR|nr:hypothetical protein [Portunus trituberculatus]
MISIPAPPRPSCPATGNEHHVSCLFLPSSLPRPPVTPLLPLSNLRPFVPTRGELQGVSQERAAPPAPAPPAAPAAAHALTSPPEGLLLQSVHRDFSWLRRCDKDAKY